MHRLTVRVYYEDTDFSGVVYHANYLRFLERGRTELLRTVGLGGRALFENQDRPAIAFVVFAMRIDFRAPARMDDLLQVETRVLDARGARARMEQRILRDATLLVTADVDVATVAGERAVRLPPQVREAFARMAAAD